MYLFFDVETRGLYGEAFAVGYILTTDTGEVVTEGINVCPRRDTDIDSLVADSCDEWLDANCLPFIPCADMASPADLRREFRLFLRSVAKHFPGPLRFVVDCGFPCESRFLLEVYKNYLAFESAGEREKVSPYPLFDLSTLLLAKGHDPVGSYARREDELPAHNPLNDSRQTMRLWFQLLRGEGVD
jgi:hypothetical protein